MLKTISVALLAASVFAAPALAATKTAQAPAKTTQLPAAKTTAAKTTQAPVIKADQTKSKAMKANAKMQHLQVRHHRHYKSQARLKLIRGARGPIHIAPTAVLSDIRPVTIASPMAAGRRLLVTEMRIPICPRSR